MKQYDATSKWIPEVGRLIVKTESSFPNNQPRMTLMFRRATDGDTMIFQHLAVIDCWQATPTKQEIGLPKEPDQTCLQMLVHHKPLPTDRAVLITFEYVTKEFLAALEPLWADKEMYFRAWLSWVLKDFQDLLEPQEYERLRSLGTMRS